MESDLNEKLRSLEEEYNRLVEGLPFLKTDEEVSLPPATATATLNWHTGQ